MPRTDAVDVATIFDTDLDSSGALSDWVEIANALVDDIADADSSLSSSRLEKIEKLVAAHLVASQDPRTERERVGDVTLEFQGETGMHFEGTKHGQAALALDPTGVLASQSKPTASLHVPDGKGIDD